MSADSQKLSQSSLMNVRNNLAYIFRFGGVCTVLKFNPSNISNEESRKLSSLIISSLNEELWDMGIDLISTNYNNGGSGFMILTTVENKDKIKKILEKLHLSKTIKNEYSITVNDILSLSGNNKALNSEYGYSTYLMAVYDNYKINTQSQLAISLNEDANTSQDIQINERSISSHLSKFGLISDSSDSGWINIVDEFSSKFASNTKKYVVPGLVVVALFYTCQYLWKKYNDLKASTELASSSSASSQPAQQNDNQEDSKEVAGNASSQAVEPFQPFEPAQPYEPSDFSVVIGQRSIGNQRLSSLLKTLEDSDVKRSKTNNIESKILSLLAETTTTH